VARRIIRGGSCISWNSWFQKEAGTTKNTKEHEKLHEVLSCGAAADFFRPYWRAGFRKDVRASRLVAGW
jgi:hypothetical protein